MFLIGSILQHSALLPSLNRDGLGSHTRMAPSEVDSMQQHHNTYIAIGHMREVFPGNFGCSSGQGTVPDLPCDRHDKQSGNG